MKNLIHNKFKMTMFLILLGIALLNPIQTKADGIPIHLTSISFDDHNGMFATINGQPVYCIQRGYPFRSAVSEMQMLRGEWNTGISSPGWEDSTTGEYHPGSDGIYEGKFSDLVTRMYDFSDLTNARVFRGWGVWEMNSDHTDAVQVSTAGAPSSSAWLEAFDEDKAPDEEIADDEDPKWENRYQGGLTVRKWFKEIGILAPDSFNMPSLLTGHEGTVEPFATTMKKISHTEAGFNMPQVYTMAISRYYIYEDPDTASYSEQAKYRVKQTFDWCTEFNFINTIGTTGKYLRLIYQDSTGNYGIHKAYTYTGSCDGYVKTTIGNNYEAMKLYRQVVWKTTNMRTIPSFANKIDKIGNAEPIKLYWDEEQRLYTATISDHNGVLNYFDFSIPGCTVTNNGDGTLTISTPNQIGTTTSTESQSKLEPADGVFKLPDFYRWDLEGKTKSFTVSLIVPDRTSLVGGSGYEEADNGNSLHRTENKESDWHHSHTEYSPACNWYCTTSKDKITHCTHAYNNCHSEPNACGKEAHTHTTSCYTFPSCNCGHPLDHTATCSIHNPAVLSCGKEAHTHSSACHNHELESDKCHTHTKACKHESTCPYYKFKNTVGFDTYVNDAPNTGTDACKVVWCCGKQHFHIETETVEGTYIDWQDVSGVYARGQKLIDPEICYIKVETVPHEFPAETDTEILLIADNDEWNDLTYTAPNGKVIKHSSHLRVGEKFHLKYIYSYKGASKGFRIEFTLENKPYYQYNYLARMQAPNNNKPIYELRTGLTGDRFALSSTSVPNAKLVQDLTDIKIRGLYQTPETAYTLNGAYSWDSGSNWNDKVYLDALVTDQFDDNYDNKAASSITSNNSSPQLTAFTVDKPTHNDMLVVWEFDTEPEVFSSALVYGTSYIEVGENDNFTKNYFDEAYNYAKDSIGSTGWTSWPYSLGDHNNVGGVGYFSSEYTGPGGPQSNNPVPNHTVYTQNNEYRTYAIRNKVWQSDVDIKVSNFVQNTGAGITEHIYQERGRDNHDMNYNLYYTIDVENPKATIFEDKQQSANGQSKSDQKTTPYDTTSDVYEFDVNNMISWGSTGSSQTNASYGNTTVVDHIKTGTTYIQREIPTVLATMTSLPKASMNFKIYPNHDRLIYEDHYTGVSVTGGDINRKVTVTVKDGYYPSNEQSYSSDIFPAMNPNVKEMQPQNISNSNNVPDQYNQSNNVLHHIGPTTSFNIKLSNGETKTIVDSHTKNYTQYDFEYNPSNRSNKVTFPGRRNSIMFFKYSKTNYSYNGNNVQSAVGEFRNSNKSQTESYYISQVLFKSNYTTKYKKELEAQGADYIEEKDVQGNLLNAWIDMVNQNKFAIVSAGQGFELKVTVKYENSYLTQYLSRYFGQDDAQNDIIGTSNRVQKKYLTSSTEKGRQFANISALTGKDGRGTPYYKDTERAYISSNSILDRLAVNLVTGANVFNDLYVFMSDNPDTVYSYSGIYDTPVIFERSIKYSEDFSVTTITYTMCVSHENGISSNLQNMKFYTNQLTPDKRTPGIVEGTYDVSSNGEHSITIWTPVVAATPFDYPNAVQDRYIGDAIELGYTIKTTGADDSIVHIVQ